MGEQSTSERILFELKTKGARPAQYFADKFSISLMGAHKALQTLVDGELVSSFDQAGGRGRPKRFFKLTEKGHGRFPDNHADLTVEIVSDVEDLFGEEGLSQLIAAREKRQLALYADQIKGSLSDRVKSLARMRNDEGYMARVEPAPEEGYLLIEDHCPICAVATSCQGFCRSELDIFKSVLGENVRVERQEHLLADARRCAYLITPR